MLHDYAKIKKIWENVTSHYKKKKDKNIVHIYKIQK